MSPLTNIARTEDWVNASKGKWQIVATNGMVYTSGFFTCPVPEDTRLASPVDIAKTVVADYRGLLIRLASQ